MKRWMSILGHPRALVQQQFEPGIFSETQTSIVLSFRGQWSQNPEIQKSQTQGFNMIQHDSTIFKFGNPSRKQE
jgi:hypothetical protein